MDGSNDIPERFIKKEFISPENIVELF